MRQPQFFTEFIRICQRNGLALTFSEICIQMSLPCYFLFFKKEIFTSNFPWKYKHFCLNCAAAFLCQVSIKMGRFANWWSHSFSPFFAFLVQSERKCSSSAFGTSSIKPQMQSNCEWPSDRVKETNAEGPRNCPHYRSRKVTCGSEEGKKAPSIFWIVGTLRTFTAHPFNVNAAIKWASFHSYCISSVRLFLSANILTALPHFNNITCYLQFHHKP